jgi:hypothetical protein
LMRLKLTWSGVLGIVILIVLAVAIPIFFFFVDVKDVFFYFYTAIIGWTVLFLLSIVGAFLLGMLVAYRILSKGDFTPFELEMMKLKDDLKRMEKKINALVENPDEIREGKGKNEGNGKDK